MSSSLHLYSTPELLELPPPEWLIDRIFPERGFVALYGKPGDGKTFIALDMALSVATGRPWQGHTVKAGPVVYVSAEGGAGIGKRVHAWLQHHELETAEALWLLQPITLSEGQPDVDELFAAIARKMAVDDVEEEGSYLVPALIVIDTLARCFLGDENLQEDMGKFIKAVDAFRDEFHSTVLVIHHARLDAGRERGSTAFRGAADTLLKVEKDNTSILLTCEKQKDSEEFEPIELKFHALPETDSVVVVSRDYDNEARAALILDLLRERPMTWEELVRGVSKLGLSEKEINYPWRLLKTRGNVSKKGKLFSAG